MAQIRNGILVIIIIVFVVIAHSHLRKTNTTYNYIFSPSDLYHYLSEANFDLSETDLTKNLEITHKYPGNYWVALLAEKPADIGTPYDSDFKVKISILNGEKVLFERTVSDTSAWFHGGDDNSGFALMDYKISNELLLDLPLSATIKVLESSAEFTNKYGSQRIIIRKTSDE